MLYFAFLLIGGSMFLLVFVGCHTPNTWIIGICLLLAYILGLSVTEIFSVVCGG